MSRRMHSMRRATASVACCRMCSYSRWWRTTSLTRRSWNGSRGPRSASFVRRRELVDYCRVCLAEHLILRIGTSRTTDCADNIALLDQWNAAPRRNDSVEREQIVEMHKLDTVLEDLCWGRKVAAGRAFVRCNL